MRILLIEEQIDISNSLVEKLKQSDHKVTIKTSALGALEYLEKNRVDILVCDNNLKYLNSLTLSQIVKRKYSVATVLIGNKFDAKISNHFDGFILRPFDYGELDELIRSVVSEKNSLRPQLEL